MATFFVCDATVCTCRDGSTDRGPFGMFGFDRTVVIKVDRVTVRHGVRVRVIGSVSSEDDVTDFCTLVLHALEESSDSRMRLLGISAAELVWTRQATDTIVLAMTE